MKTAEGASPSLRFLHIRSSMPSTMNHSIFNTACNPEKVAEVIERPHADHSTVRNSSTKKSIPTTAERLNYRPSISLSQTNFSCVTVYKCPHQFSLSSGDSVKYPFYYKTPTSRGGNGTNYTDSNLHKVSVSLNYLGGKGKVGLIDTFPNAQSGFGRVSFFIPYPALMNAPKCLHTRYLDFTETEFGCRLIFQNIQTTHSGDLPDIYRHCDSCPLYGSG